jgi:hypothetical protein
MRRKGHFLGGGTVIGPRDPTWFKKGSMRAPPKDGAPKPSLSLAEKAALQAFKQERESGGRLIRKGEKGPPKKRFGKAKGVKPRPSVIKPGRSLPA